MKRHERLKRVLEYLDDERDNWVKYNAKNLRLVSRKFSKLRFEMILDLERDVKRLEKLNTDSEAAILHYQKRVNKANKKLFPLEYRADKLKSEGIE